VGNQCGLLRVHWPGSTIVRCTLFSSSAPDLQVVYVEHCSILVPTLFKRFMLERVLCMHRSVNDSNSLCFLEHHGATC